MEILRAEGLRAVAFGALAEIGYRRLLLLRHSLGHLVPPSDSSRLDVEFAFLMSSEVEEYAAFRPDTDPLEVRRRLDAGHLCAVGRTPGQRMVTASWIGRGRCRVPYLGCVLDLQDDEAYSYDWLTEPSVRGMGAARARLAWELDLLRDRGVSCALTAILPENRGAWSIARSAGFEHQGVLRSAWLGGRRQTWLSDRKGRASDHPALVRRREWGAAPPREKLVKRGRLRAFVLHHTAISEPGLRTGGGQAEIDYMRSVEKLHLSRGWLAIGYHFVIMPSGRIFEGRPMNTLGAHVRGHNKGTIGIALAGNFDREEPAAAALAAIDRIRAEIVPDAHAVPMVGHRDLAADTSCPGKTLYRLLPRNYVRGRREPLSGSIVSMKSAD